MLKKIANGLGWLFLVIALLLLGKKKKPKEKTTDWKEVQALLKKEIPKAALFLVDEKYYIPDIAEVKDFLKEDKTDLIKYLKDTFDCDDYAVLLAGASRLKSKFRLGVACSVIHAYNIIPVIEDGEMRIKIIEPQTDQIFSVQEAEKGSKAYKTKFVWL